MTRNRGCFDRHDDEPDANEYASSPCYMHQVDPSYFGLEPPTRSIPDRKPGHPQSIVNVHVRARVPEDKFVPYAKFRTLMGKLSQAVGRHAATQIERVEARLKVRAVARLRARTGSKR